MNALLRLIAAFVSGMAMFGAVFGQSYPSKPVRIISPFPPGGPSDVAARFVAQKLSEAMVQPFVVENRPGATGSIGSLFVAKAPPDGYTLLMGATSSHIAPYLLKTQSYDPARDLSPIISVGSMPFYLMVHSSVGAKSLNEFITLAKNRPRRFTYATPGNGSLAHLCVELFKARVSVELVHVPYKGSAPAVSDLLAGRVDMACNATPIKSEQMRVLAVTGNKRSAALPGVPTTAEAGLSNFELSLWLGLFGPARLPSGIADSLNSEINKILGATDMQERLRALNIEHVPNTPEQFAGFLKVDTPRWEQVIRDVGVQVD